MSDKKNSNKNSEIDFTSSPFFRKSTRKSKWKQLFLYTVVSCITVAGFIITVHLGTQHLLTNKIADYRKDQNYNIRGLSQGAGITGNKTRYHHNLFSVLAKQTSYKKIGTRQIVWDTSTTKIPVIGNIEVIDRGVGMSEAYKIKTEDQRVVRYNELNNERFIDFYYPGMDYNYLSQELSIATGLDENKLIEVALSFKKPMKLSKLGKTLGFENVDWLWVNRKTPEELEKLESKWDEDKWKLKRGEDAYGFSVSAKYPYTEYTHKNTTIIGAVVSGTPKELERFQDLEFVRASVLGATIDKY